MELKVKNLKLYAGRPIVFLDERTAEKLNVLQNSRVMISNSKSLNANVDIFTRIVREDEIGFSHEVSNFFKLKEGARVRVNVSENSLVSEILREKMEGKKFSYEDFKKILENIIKNNLGEAEVASFVTIQKVLGLNLQETRDLTKAMVNTGIKLKFDKKIIADKHCIGGVAGNRTTPIIGSICAAAGLTIPKSSTKAITSAAGTADVIETIAKIDFSPEELKKIVKQTNGCFLLGGSLNLSPSDEKIIRIERILGLDIKSQMIASVLSKKISMGSNHLLIDIPYGQGSKVPNLKEAKNIGRLFKEISKPFNIKLKIVYTDGSQPIGNGFGPILEMIDVLSVLKNEKDAPQDLKEKSLKLSSELMSLCGIKNSKELAKNILEQRLAYEKFQEIMNTQNSKNNFESKVKSLVPAKYKKTFLSNRKGIIREISNKKINTLCRILGSPDTKSAGVFLHNHKGPVKNGEKLITFYSESKDKLQEAINYYKKEKIIQLV